jgi:hypothetical protein
MPSLVETAKNEAPTPDSFDSFDSFDRFVFSTFEDAFTQASPSLSDASSYFPVR